VSVWREGSGESETHNFRTPLTELPQRAMSLLYALARGHALLHGRRQLTDDDPAIVGRVALESCPHDRRIAMRLLLENGGVVSTSQLQHALPCSAPTARAIMETLSLLRIGQLNNPGAPFEARLTLAYDLDWLLESGYGLGQEDPDTAPPGHV